ncbi:hypothetical protein DL96DRAFT_1616099 [Flagelloscypha sp. PMI_526]|nr:hypothetical protein DL96DRAFT_1616099 [Flagelloscypha sp. PMI_526]
MASVRSSRIGTVSGGPHRNFWFPWWNYPKHAFDSVGDLLDWYRALFLTNGGEAWLNKVMALFPRNAAIVFTPGDLHPGNIIVQGSTITEVIDWHTGGFYPSYWDYARMHHPCFASVGWDHILGKVFPGEKRMDEIKACAEIIRIIDYTFAC